MSSYVFVKHIQLFWQGKALVWLVQYGWQALLWGEFDLDFYLKMLELRNLFQNITKKNFINRFIRGDGFIY